MSDETRYYYVDAQNQAAGPIAMAGLLALKAAGTVTDATLVVVEGGSEWVAFSTLKAEGASKGGAGTLQIPPRERDANPSQSDWPGWAGEGPKGPSSAPEGVRGEGGSTGEPPWVAHLTQKIDLLTAAMDKLAAALEKSRPPAPVATPATAALHAEKINLNPAPKPGIAALSPQTISRPTPLPTGIAVTPPKNPAPVHRPAISTPLSPLAVPANAQKSALPLPALGKTPGPAPAGIPKPMTPAPAKGNIFSKFLKK